MTIYTRRNVGQGIPLVPMLDILTILLLFFVVHTEFKCQVSVLPIELPQTRHLAGEQGDADQVLLELDEHGTIALGGKHLNPEQLVPAVRALLKQNPKVKIQVSAAQGSSMGAFVEVMDTLTSAGLEVEQVPVRIEYRPR